MTKLDHFLSHGKHNELACSHLLTSNTDLSDWVVTTSFYSALQFVSYKIFPLAVSSIEGKKTQLNDISQYSSYSNPKRLSRHELLDNLVSKHCPEIAEDYTWLMNMSMTARYTNYQQPKEIANKAVTLLGRIKKHCIAK